MATDIRLKPPCANGIENPRELGVRGGFVVYGLYAYPHYNKIIKYMQDIFKQVLSHLAQTE